jgi:parallel beta-helix repeat protein
MGEKIALVLFGLLLIFSYSSVLRAVTGFQYNRLSAYLQEKAIIMGSATWWVPDNFETIQEAINSPLVSLGDTIRVRQGIYNEHLVVNKTVSLIGENRLTTFIDGSGTGTIVNITANNVYFSGFTVKNGDYGICVFGSTDSAVIGNNANNNYGFGIIVDYFSSNCTISENNATQNWIGISVEKESHNCTITENNVENNDYHGLQIYLSQDCRITRNNAKNNLYYGIYVSFSNNSIISKNTADSNGEGINLEESDHCNVDKNLAQNNYYGIWFLYSDHSVAVGNTASNNTVGVYLYCSNNTIFYHNNFVNNTNQVEITESHKNAWDNSYPSGGNYWSNYTGIDRFSGSGQDELGSDGIGDTPHVIDVNNADNYPLMKPWTNIAILSISPSKTVIGKGFTLYIYVSVQNQGWNTETFNITAYANATTITTLMNIAITGRNCSTLTLIWNTTGFAKGNYTIWAYAWPVPGETDTADNTLIDGWIKETIQGDVTGDFKVDILDIATIAKAYGAYPGHLKWDPNADLDNSNKIDIIDIAKAAKNYGKTDP